MSSVSDSVGPEARVTDTPAVGAPWRRARITERSTVNSGRAGGRQLVVRVSAGPRSIVILRLSEMFSLPAASPRRPIERNASRS